MENKARFGDLLGATFTIVGKNAVPVLIYVMLLGLANTAGMLWGLIEVDENVVGFQTGFILDENTDLFGGVYQLAVAIATFAATYFLLSKFVESIGRLSTRETRIWAYLGLSLLSGIGTVLGFVLLIIPGIILLVRWSASAGFLIGHRESITDSLNASWNATRGSSWPIFFAGLVLVIGFLIVVGSLAAAATATGIESVTAIVSGFADVIGNVVTTAFGIAVYLLVSADNDRIGEVFS